MSEENELPEGWVTTKLEDICTIIMGQSPPSSAYNEDGEGLPFFQGKAEFTDLFPEVRKWCIAPTKIAEANDILLSVRAPVGPTNLAPSLCCIGRGLAAIRPDNDIQVRYVLYTIRAFNSHLTELGTGTTFAAVSGDDVRAFEIPLAPTNEQHRIVAAIEQQFTRLDVGVAALQRARIKLKRYRAAVLKAAVEGKLTEAWRTEHPTTELASMLLERILKERRARWEVDLRAKGKDPAKVKYVEPAVPDVEGLSELPEGWCWATLEQLSDESRAITYGVVKLGDPVVGGVPTLRSSNVRHLRFDLEGLKFISPTIANGYKRTFLQGSEVLVTVRGTLGGVAVVPDDFTGYNISREVAMIAFVLPSLAPCLALFIGSPPIQNWMMKSTKGIAYTGINIETLKEAIIPLPPFAEQVQIVAEVERRLSVISQLEATVEANLKRAERLRQSILSEAFAGRLVPQDPNDEPASVLLERIRSERGSRERKNGTGASKGNKGRAVKVPEPGVLDTKGAEQVELWENVGGGYALRSD